MELIVDGKNVLEPVNLEKNKNEIMQQRASVPSQVSLTHFKENVGFFKANVKGDDMNGLVTELQKTFSDINTRETKMYDQLDTVFRTVESIHKGSIEGIIVGVKSAQEAISQAEYAIETISEALVVLQNFKNQLEENTEHLNDIDVIWDATQQLNRDVKELEKSLLEKVKKISENIKTLMNLKSNLDKLKHIKDVDSMHKDLLDMRQKFEQEKKNSTGRMATISVEIQQLQQFKEAVEGIEHLKDVDALWESNEHLKHSVDELDKSATNNGEKINTVEENVQHNADEIVNLKNELLKYEALEKEVIQLKGKVKILCYALGGTIGVVVLQIILSMIGIL